MERGCWGVDGDNQESSLKLEEAQEDYGRQMSTRFGVLIAATNVSRGIGKSDN